MTLSHILLTSILLLALPLAACGRGSAHYEPAAASSMTKALLISEADSAPMAPRMSSMPHDVTAPLAGQMKALASKPSKRSSGSPLDRVAKANREARMQPAKEGFVNAVQVYPWTEGALYQVYTAPGQISDIALQKGEKLIGPGPIAAGDTVRWIIGDTVSGRGANARVHVLVKPVASRLSTNLIINTDRRTYHIELNSTPKAYMASVSWTYPQDEMRLLQSSRAQAERMLPISEEINLGNLNFGYKISGDKPLWRPLRVFDDGRQVFIAFPEYIAQGELPPLFVRGASGKSELVNYRVRKNHMIVDQLFEVAELRLGAKKQKVVRIKRKHARR